MKTYLGVDVGSVTTKLALLDDQDQLIASTYLALLEFESGARGVISSSYISPKTYYIRIYGTEGTLDYTTDMSIWPDPDRIEQVTSLTIQSNNGEENISFEPRQMLIEELEEFAQCVRGEAEPETGAREALAALQVIRGAIESHELGKSISLEVL